MARDLSQSKLTLVTSAGLHLRGDRPFTELDPAVMPRTPLDFLPNTLLPMIRARGVDEPTIRKITTENPARVFTFH